MRTCVRACASSCAVVFLSYTCLCLRACMRLCAISCTVLRASNIVVRVDAITPDFNVSQFPRNLRIDEKTAMKVPFSLKFCFSLFQLTSQSAASPCIWGPQRICTPLGLCTDSRETDRQLSSCRERETMSFLQRSIEVVLASLYCHFFRSVVIPPHLFGVD